MAQLYFISIFYCEFFMKRIYSILVLVGIVVFMSVNVLISQNAEIQPNDLTLSRANNGYYGNNEIYNSWTNPRGGETKIYDVWINDWCPNEEGVFSVFRGVFIDAQGREIGTSMVLTANEQGKIIGQLKIKWDNAPNMAGTSLIGSIYFNHGLDICWLEDGDLFCYSFCRDVMIYNLPESEASSLSDPLTPSVLCQNAPNPAQGTTTVEFYIPETVGTAILQLFNNTQLIEMWNISQRGEGEQLINTSELAPGIYYYSLIVDGVSAGTKRMVVQ